MFRSGMGWLMEDLPHRGFPYSWSNGQPYRRFPHSCDYGLPYRESPYPGKTVSHTVGPHFHKGILIFPGKWGPGVQKQANKSCGVLPTRGHQYCARIYSDHQFSATID